MPLPLLFIGIAVATGGLGLGKTVKAGVDARTAHKINNSARELVEDATDTLNRQRKACGDALSHLGEEKVFVLRNTMREFLDTFVKIKNVDFRDSVGLDELKDIELGDNKFKEIRALVDFAGGIGGGAAAGAAGGALVAFGAYGAAQALACASTGTAIASLSGAAATNATLAFFGGGSLAAGGLGMAGGTVVLGGLVAGPALMLMGFVVGAVAKKDLDKAYTNQAEAQKLSEEMDTASQQCSAVRRRTYMFYNLLARLDTYFLPLIYRMEDIVRNEDDDYSCYSTESRRTIASCASVAVTIKTVLDTPLLAEDGLLTPESEETAGMVEKSIRRIELI